MAKPRTWSMETAMIKGKPVKESPKHKTKYCHIRCNSQGKNRIVVEFVTEPIARFLVAAANEMEMKK